MGNLEESRGAPLNHEDRPPTGPTMSLDLPYLMTVPEVAAFLRTTAKAVYARIERGLLPGVVRDGRRLLVKRDDLVAHIERAATVGAGKTGASRESPR